MLTLKRPAALLSLLAMLPAGLAAQKHAFQFYGFGGQHARIGVVVDMEPDSARDKLGAEIEAVTPEGPADKAGLKAGDIITKFNGQALGGAISSDDDQSGPGRKLVKLSRVLEPGDTVRLDYRRGALAKTATLVAEDMEERAFAGMRHWQGPDMMDMQSFLMPRPGRGEGGFEFFIGDDWRGLQLVSLNPDLGSYFGAKEGVLVVTPPRDSTLALKGGDVILNIDGRKPSSPGQVFRILRSYDTGETVKIAVLRKQKQATVTWTVPESKRMKWHNSGPGADEEDEHIEIERS